MSVSEVPRQLVRPRRRGPLSCAGLMVVVLATACSPAPTTRTDAAPTKPPSVIRPSTSGSAIPLPSGTPRTTVARPGPRATAHQPSLVGDHRNAFAFAPLDHPADVTVEGQVSSSPAWSTSKVLVVAAFLKTAAGGDPARVSARNRRLVTEALTESDADAVVALRSQIPGRPGPAMTAVLRQIGDTTTVAPDSYQGLMPWSVREQVRFMAALGRGKVVSRAASAYLLTAMHPIRAHSWGLGQIGATSYKGGWLRANTVTRQMGIVDGYAVAIITDSVGPAVVQTDGDSAHVRQMNRLAALLRERLDHERSGR